MRTFALALGRSPGTEATRSTARTAARLVLDGYADHALMSGRWSVFDPKGHDTTEAADMEAVALGLGVRPEDILTDHWARDTFTNMIGSLRAIQTRGFTMARIILVTIPGAELRATYAADLVFPAGYLVVRVVPSDLATTRTEKIKLLLKERWIYWTTRLLLIGIKRGDLIGIERRLRLAHPGYRSSKVANPIRFNEP